MTPARWLLVAMAVYFAMSFSLSWLRAVELQTTTWDQGLFQQALWTTAHGHPFYETADVETGGYGSLLDVHSVFVLYLVVPLYSILPYEATLFAVQSAVVALAAVPLYLLARDITGSPRLGLVAGLTYLCWAPTLTSNLYDFHAEAFLPIEIFALVLLWNRGRYGAGFAVALLAFLTLEFAPILVFAVGVFALLPESVSLARGRAVRARTPSRFGRELRAWARTPRVRASLTLISASVAAYAALLVLRVDILPSLLGTYPLPEAPTGYVIGATPAALGLAMGNLAVGFGPKVIYWLTVVGLLAFIPLLAPRALLLTAPWCVFTLFSSNLNYVTLGFQYGLVVGSTLMIAFAFGLSRARQAVEQWTSRPIPATHSPVQWRGLPRRFGSLPASVVAGMVVLLTINIALTPVDPVMQNSGLGSAYRVSYDPPPGSTDVARLAALIPGGATVLATDDLFPLVANDPNAYSFLWAPDPWLYLPFSLANPPTFVFIAEDRTAAVAAWLNGALYNPAVYGVRGVAWSSPAGTVLLFEAGYSGRTTEFGTVSPLGGTYYGPSIAAGPAGFPTTASGSTFPAVVESVAGATGTVWCGPGLSLPAGQYTASLSLRLTPLEGFPSPNASTVALWITAFGYAQPLFYGGSFPFGALDGARFVSVSFPVTLSAPTIEFDIEGQLLDSSVQVTLNYLEIEPQ